MLTGEKVITYKNSENPLEIKYADMTSNYISTLVNSLKTYNSLYGYKQESYLVTKIYSVYEILQKELQKIYSPPIIQIPSNKGPITVYSCSIKACLIESIEQTVCHITAYSYPFYEKIDISYKNTIY